MTLDFHHVRLCCQLNSKLIMENYMKKIFGLALIMGLVPCTSYAEHHMDKGNMDKMFSECDANSDGKISKDEFMKHKMDSFTTADKNNDGLLSKEESEAMMKEMHDKMMKDHM